MKLATVRTSTGTRAVRIEDDVAIELGVDDLDAVLARPDWRAWASEASGPERAVEDLNFAPPVLRPEKVVCVGLNYRNHILEMGHDVPDHPTLFAKFSRALIGAHDDITLPRDSTCVDWEAELGVIVGAPLRYASVEDAAGAIAGLTVVNDVTARDFQYRTQQWLQGKTWEASTPVGPYLVVDAEPGGITCEVDGEVMQRADTADLVFDCATLLAYISKIVTLVPGDLIATGTPGGVGHARTPPRYLGDGSVVVSRVDGVGELRNVCRADKRATAV